MIKIIKNRKNKKGNIGQIFYFLGLGLLLLIAIIAGIAFGKYLLTHFG